MYCVLGNHCSVFQISEYQAIFEYSHSLQSQDVPLSGFWILALVACSRRSDSGERCEVKRSAKK